MPTRYDTDIVYEAEISQAAEVVDPPFKIVKDDGTLLSFGTETVTVKVYDPDGTEITGTGVVAAAVTASSSLIALTLKTTDSQFELDENYRADISVTVSSVAYRRTFFFDVVKRKFRLQLSVDDMPPELEYARDETSFTRIFQTARATLLRDLRNSRIQRPKSAYRDETYYAIEGEKELVNIQPGLIRNPTCLFESLKAKAFEIAYREGIREAGDAFHEQWIYHRDLYPLKLSEGISNIKYDSDEDLEIEETEKPLLRNKMIR